MSDSGDITGSLEVIREAVDIRRRLVKANPAAYESDLATGLNNLSITLSYSGDNPGALKAILEAVDICRRLAKVNPAAYEPDLAMSLNNASNRLRDSGDLSGALQVILEAVGIHKRHAKLTRPPIKMPEEPSLVPQPSQTSQRRFRRPAVPRRNR